MTSDKKKAGNGARGKKKSIQNTSSCGRNNSKKSGSSIQTKAAPNPFLIPLSAFHAPCPKPIP